MAYVAGFSEALGSNGGTSSSSINSTGANLIVVAVAYYDGAPISGVSDSKSNTYSPRTVYNESGTGSAIQLYYSVPTTVGASHTITIDRLGAYISIAVMAWSGATASPYHSENGATATGQESLAAGSVSPAAANDLAVAAISWGANRTMSIDDGYTIVGQTSFGSSDHYGVALAYKTVSAATNPSWSWTTSESAAATAATFNLESAAPTWTPRVTMVL